MASPWAFSCTFVFRSAFTQPCWAIFAPARERYASSDGLDPSAWICTRLCSNAPELVDATGFEPVFPGFWPRAGSHAYNTHCLSLQTVTPADVGVHGCVLAVLGVHTPQPSVQLAPRRTQRQRGFSCNSVLTLTQPLCHLPIHVLTTVQCAETVTYWTTAAVTIDP
jgi:hypothetical protein